MYLLQYNALLLTYHDSEALIVDAVVVDWGLQKMGIFVEPKSGPSAWGFTNPSAYTVRPYHLGKFSGVESIFSVVESWSSRIDETFTRHWKAPGLSRSGLRAHTSQLSSESIKKLNVIVYECYLEETVPITLLSTDVFYR